jgi:hypothetical protein
MKNGYGYGRAWMKRMMDGGGDVGRIQSWVGEEGGEAVPCNTGTGDGGARFATSYSAEGMALGI